MSLRDEIRALITDIEAAIERVQRERTAELAELRSEKAALEDDERQITPQVEALFRRVNRKLDRKG